MSGVEDKKNVFVQLQEASTSIREGFKTILEVAPDITLYNTLIESQNNPFLKGLMNTGNVDLNDSEIKFAVQVKELYESGKMDIVKSLVNGNLDNVIESLKSSSKFSDSESSKAKTTPKDHCDDAIDMKKDDTTYNPEIVGSETNPYVDDIANKGGKTNTSESQNGNSSEKTSSSAEHNFNGPEVDEDISELYTGVALVSSSTVHHANETHDSIHKRNRNFQIFKEEKPPKLPEIHLPELLAKVFTHQSVLNYLNIPEEAKVHSHNERLEFLGDAFLQFVVSMIIYEKFPNFNEGQLSILRSKIVSNSRLLKFSQIYGFDKQLKKNFNDTSILTGNNKIYADVFEAYLGAVAEQYMLETKEGETNVNDFVRGWFVAKDWIEELCEEQLRTFDPSIVFKMQYSKSSKQDLRLLLGQLNVPDYIRCNLSNRRILSCVKVSKKIYGYGIGTSNKEADARAATDAMSNPGIRKICPDDLWKKFEDGVGVTEQGALKLDQYPTIVSKKDMDILRKEIAIKYKNGDIKLLASNNNPISLLIDDRTRETVNKELKELHSIDNTNGEIGISNNIDGEGRLKDINSEKDNKKYPKDKFYSKEYTMGRGGIFAEEYQRVSKGESKYRGGIHRNAKYIIMDEGEDGSGSVNATRSIMCHEVLVKCDDIDMDSKNRMNAIFSKRGGIPGYITYKTANGEFLCEMWFSNKQIVSYGLDKNKRLASQKAAMLAVKREEYYADSVSDEGELEDDEDFDDTMVEKSRSNRSSSDSESDKERRSKKALKKHKSRSRQDSSESEESSESESEEDSDSD